MRHVLCSVPLAVQAAEAWLEKGGRDGSVAVALQQERQGKHSRVCRLSAAVAALDNVAPRRTCTLLPLPPLGLGETSAFRTDRSAGLCHRDDPMKHAGHAKRQA